MADNGALPDGRVLLVEGKDDLHVVRHLFQFSGLTGVCIIDKQGFETLSKSIRAEVLAEGRTAVGILVDANDTLESRWRAISGRLEAADVEAPHKPCANGTIIEIDGKPRVGVWLMPNNQSPGELEDFIADMIPPGDGVWPLSKAYINAIPLSDREFAQRKVMRAKVHAWLATRERPRPMGQSLGLGDLNVDADICKRFVAWLRKLFES